MEKDEVSIDVQEKSSLNRRTCGSRFLEWCRGHKFIVIPVAVMILLLPLLGLLALRKANAKWTSPITYPSPQGYGAGNWSAAYDKASAMVAKMSLQEMNMVTYGISDSRTGCVGVSAGVHRLGFPGLCLHDAGNGVRNTDGVNAYASGLHVGASWNATLAYERAQHMGDEFKKKGINVALGPVVGPIGRIAEGGRNWEGFGADPYLNGILGAQTVIGLQESVIASIKHFVAYEQETNRNPITQGGIVTKSTSANVDDQTMHELYLWPFQDLVYAGVGSVMCGYNRINNTYACENSKVMNGLLKGELDFQGFVVSDWVGQHSGVASANAGLDMAMPTSPYWNNGQLAGAVTAEVLNRTRLEDMATRIIATWYQFGQDNDNFPELGIGMPNDLLQPHKYVDAKVPSSKDILLQQAIEGHALVKNINEALPLSKPKVLSIFGYDAITQHSSTPGPVDIDGTSQDLFTRNWGSINLQTLQLAEIASNAPVSNPPSTAGGTLLVGGGSGTNTPAYISSPYDALQARAYDDGTTLFHDFFSNNPDVAASSDACLVFVNEYASEAFDRRGLADPDSDVLIGNVASKCKNTIVVIHNAGIRVVDAWIENPNVTAVLFAHLPGQDAGRALVQLLYGEVSPSGRLPYTVAKSPDDYGNLQSPCSDTNTLSPQCTFTEGVNIDYRSFLARDITPRYEFGYGLTYSSFAYSDLILNINVTATDNRISSASVYTNGQTNNKGNPAVGVGGLTSLFESVGTVQATIANTGKVAAAEVAQLYIRTPSMTTRALRGFQKMYIQSGATAQARFSLRQKDVSSWDTEKQAWIVPEGTFHVFVGKSVLDTRLVGTFMT